MRNKVEAYLTRGMEWLRGGRINPVKVKKRTATILLTAFMIAVCLSFSATASATEANTDIFKVGETALRKVYKDVAGIATVAAAACAAVCMFLMYFSKSGKTVDEARIWLKRIAIIWAAIMTLGGIVTYMQTLVPKIDLK